MLSKNLHSLASLVSLQGLLLFRHQQRWTWKYPHSSISSPKKNSFAVQAEKILGDRLSRPTFGGQMLFHAGGWVYRRRLNLSNGKGRKWGEIKRKEGIGGKISKCSWRCREVKRAAENMGFNKAMFKVGMGFLFHFCKKSDRSWAKQKISS